MERLKKDGYFPAPITAGLMTWKVNWWECRLAMKALMASTAMH